MPMHMTGWSRGGARVPLSYNLRAGQFRGFNNVNYYSNTNNINIFNNCKHSSCCGGGYNFDYGCNQQNSTPSWMQWLTFGGMLTNMLGGILDMFRKPAAESTIDGKGDPGVTTTTTTTPKTPAAANSPEKDAAGPADKDKATSSADSPFKVWSETETVTNQEYTYKLKHGESLYDVVRDKYGVTDYKTIMEIVHAIKDNYDIDYNISTARTEWVLPAEVNGHKLNSGASVIGTVEDFSGGNGAIGSYTAKSTSTTTEFWRNNYDQTRYTSRKEAEDAARAAANKKSSD